jgi:hypothetical protein
MNDREMLELAAKSAGIEIDKSPYNGGGLGNTGFDVAGNAVLDWHNNETWNPLTDDGDVFRLDCYCREHFGGGYIDDMNMYREKYIKEGMIFIDATRRAIVRAAAEFGRNMK